MNKYLLNTVQQYFKYWNQFSTALVVCLTMLPVIPFKASAVLQDSGCVVTFTPGEALGSKLMKAAHVRPSPAQIKWMERERNVFIHYGMNTFHGADWGSGTENPKDFAPTAQNPEQWAKVIKEAKFSMVIPTAKHHDGFCLWNTATTNQSIKNATVTADVIDALKKGCTKYGLDLGIYLSPWDMNQDKAGTWKIDGYNTFFIKQLKELLGGNYGEKGSMGELWFDGACGSLPIWQPASWYRPNVWYDTLESLQPMAVIRLYDGFYFSDESRWAAIQQGTQKLQWRGKEIRWCGNEGGTGRSDEWAVQPVWTRFFGSEQQNNDLGQEKYYENAVGAAWYQSEVNTSIAKDQWFWHSTGYDLKSLNDMKTLYYNSIGNNANLLLNLLPDNRGLIPDDQINLLKNWNNWIDSSFTKNWAKGATIIATVLNAFPEAQGHEADKIMDNKRHTYWTPEGTWNIGTSKATITVSLPTPQTFDHVMIKEYVYNGQRVAGWELEYYDAGTSSWKSLVTGKKVIGYKRICKFNQVTSSKVRLNITRSWDSPEISDFALYQTLSGIDTIHEDTQIPAPVVQQKTLKVNLIQPKISLSGKKLVLETMGIPIKLVEVVTLNGGSIMKVSNPRSRIVSNTISSGVYLIKIDTGERIFHNTIAVSQ